LVVMPCAANLAVSSPRRHTVPRRRSPRPSPNGDAVMLLRGCRGVGAARAGTLTMLADWTMPLKLHAVPARASAAHSERGGRSRYVRYVLPVPDGLTPGSFMTGSSLNEFDPISEIGYGSARRMASAWANGGVRSDRRNRLSRSDVGAPSMARLRPVVVRWTPACSVLRWSQNAMSPGGPAPPDDKIPA